MEKFLRIDFFLPFQKLSTSAFQTCFNRLNLNGVASELIKQIRHGNYDEKSDVFTGYKTPVTHSLVTG